MSTRCIICPQVSNNLFINITLNTIGNWSIPDVIGQFMPPASFFILKKIDNSRAVVFGGATGENDDIICSNILYVINTKVNAVVCYITK